MTGGPPGKIFRQIEKCFQVTRDSVWAVPCLGGGRQYVVRDSGDQSKVRDTDAVFDQVDRILAVSGETSLDPVDTCLLLTMTLLLYYIMIYCTFSDRNFCFFLTIVQRLVSLRINWTPETTLRDYTQRATVT